MFNKRKQQSPLQKEQSLEEVLSTAKKSSDFYRFSPSNHEGILISYYKSLIDPKLLHECILKYLQENHGDIQTLKDIKRLLPLEEILITDHSAEVEKHLHHGYALIQLSGNDSQCALVNIENAALGQRNENQTENEYVAVGRNAGLVENINVNLHLLRQQLPTADLVFEEMKVGNRSTTMVVIAYLEGLTNPQFIRTVKERITNIDIDGLFDTAQLEQLISDHSASPFPTFASTERIDRVSYFLLNGQIAVICDGSPRVLFGPTSFFQFFFSTEDYYVPWIHASLIRMIRIFGVFFSVFATSLYVAVLTYHYEVIPKELLGSIIYSRAHVPFSPFLEVMFLEVTIELLREASVRLPSKIGQTVGVVGGIVIGQATVQAALTSNILLIIVALSALASFTTPIYKMSDTVRFLRFPFIFLAAVWGGYGLAIGVVGILGHLFRLKSLGVPYMVPLYPFRRKSLLNTIIRPSYVFLNKVPAFFRPLSTTKYKPGTDKDVEHDLNNE